MGHHERVTPTTRRVAVLAPMEPELKAIVRAFGLRAAEEPGPFSHTGAAGDWWVGSFVTGMGPSKGADAARRALEGASGRLDHMMVVGIAGGLDPALPVGSLFVPARVRLHAAGPEYTPHTRPGRPGGGGVMTPDGLFHDEAVWRPMPEQGFGAVDMEASGVAQVCEEAGVPWSVYRGISDRPDERIVDQDVFALSKPDGTADPVALAKYLARDPRRAKALAHLNRAMKAAATAAAEAAFTDLCSC